MAEGQAGRTGRPTLLLTRAQLECCLDRAVLVEELEAAHVAVDGRHERPQRVRSRPAPQVTAMVLLPGTAPGIPAYTVKVHAKNPARRPALTGVICLHDLGTGDLLAIMDSGWLTAVRTGIAAASGTHRLARKGATRVGVIGAGRQGEAQLDQLSRLRPLTTVRIFDTVPETSQTLVDHVRNRLRLDAEACSSVDEVARTSDVLLVATWSTVAVVAERHVRPGMHITSLGADEPGKIELDDAVLAGALVITDDRTLAGAVLPRIDATLSQVLRGEHPGRAHPGQVTVYSPVGLPLQDCVIAWHAYQAALKRGCGTAVTLEA